MLLDWNQSPETSKPDWLKSSYRLEEEEEESPGLVDTIGSPDFSSASSVVSASSWFPDMGYSFSGYEPAGDDADLQVAGVSSTRASSHTASPNIYAYQESPDGLLNNPQHLKTGPFGEIGLMLEDPDHPSFSLGGNDIPQGAQQQQQQQQPDSDTGSERVFIMPNQQVLQLGPAPQLSASTLEILQHQGMLQHLQTQVMPFADIQSIAAVTSTAIGAAAPVGTVPQPPLLPFSLPHGSDSPAAQTWQGSPFQSSKGSFAGGTGPLLAGGVVHNTSVSPLAVENHAALQGGRSMSAPTWSLNSTDEAAYFASVVASQAMQPDRSTNHACTQDHLVEAAHFPSTSSPAASRRPSTAGLLDGTASSSSPTPAFADVISNGMVSTTPTLARSSAMLPYSAPGSLLRSSPPQHPKTLLHQALLHQQQQQQKQKQKQTQQQQQQPHSFSHSFDALVPERFAYSSQIVQPASLQQTAQIQHLFSDSSHHGATSLPALESGARPLQAAQPLFRQTAVPQHKSEASSAPTNGAQSRVQASSLHLESFSDAGSHGDGHPGSGRSEGATSRSRGRGTRTTMNMKGLYTRDLVDAAFPGEWGNGELSRIAGRRAYH